MAGAGRGRRFTVMVIASCVVVVVLLVAGVWAAVTWLSGAAADADRADAVDAGREMSVSLTSVNFETADADVERVLDGATGDFAELFRTNQRSYVSIVKEGAVVSTGNVLEAGVSQYDGQTATVLTAVQNKVKNKVTPQGESRSYRMSLQMSKVDDSWKVSKVEFIP